MLLMLRVNNMEYKSTYIYIYIYMLEVSHREVVKLVKLTLIIGGHEHVDLETLLHQKDRHKEKSRDKDFQVGAG